MGYLISTIHKGQYLHLRALYYSKREAVRQFREHYGLKHKRLDLTIEPIRGGC